MSSFSLHASAAFYLVFTSRAVLASAYPSHDANQDSSTMAIANSGSSMKVRVIPGAEYEAGWLHRFLAGAHWRDLWTTEFEASILDLDHFAGGLTPTEKGGSLQTKGLRFIGNDGREYKFRSMNKDGKKVLPPELQKSIIADIYQDQISIGNPMASVVVAPLLNAVGSRIASAFGGWVWYKLSVHP